MLRNFLKAPEPRAHGGEPYVAFLEKLHLWLQPRSYLEIGTLTGASLSVARCPAICIDPEFRIETNVFAGRSQTLMFQMTSDAFFRDHDVRKFFPAGVDLCFLDGMHRLEYLYRDFSNAEKACHARSMIMLHDCLPLDGRMAERTFTPGPEGDPRRDMWSGDVWKLIPILRKHRPDLRIFFVDAPPTGLALVTNLDGASRVLDERYYEILDETAGLTLEKHGFDRLYKECPTLDSRKLTRDPHALTAFFSLY